VHDFGTWALIVLPFRASLVGLRATHGAKSGSKFRRFGPSLDLKTDRRPRVESRNYLSCLRKEWYARADSNGRPFAPEANALSS
jgi:hypothetical protein